METGLGNGRRRAALLGKLRRSEMEELCSTRREGEVEAGGGHLGAVAPVFFLAEQVFHLPLSASETLDARAHVALAGMRCEVDHDEIEGVRRGLPLDDDEAVVGRVLRPSGARAEDFKVSVAHGAVVEGREQLFVERGELRVSFVPKRPMEADMCSL